MKRETGWERWRDMAGEGARAPGDVDAAIGDMLRKAGRAPGLSAGRLARIERKLLREPARGFGLPLLRWAIVGGVLLSTSGLMAAMGGPRRVLEATRALVARVFEAAPAPARPSNRSSRRRAEGTPAGVVASAAVVVNAEPPELAPPPVAAVAPPLPEGDRGERAVRPGGSRLRERVGARTERVGLPPVGAAEPIAGGAGLAPSPGAGAAASEPLAELSPALAEEAALLRGAIARLRRQSDPEGALRGLDEYQRRFPSGTLASEAALARIDALLALERYDEAMALGRDAPHLPLERRRELYVIDAERQAQRDCRLAIKRFDALLDGELPAPLRERALYGRAGCKLRSGLDAAARADLWQYLAEFPGGRFAPQVKQALR